MAFDIFWMNVAAVFAFANVALVLLLIGFYFQSWRKMRSSLSVALMSFAVFFLIQNGVIIVFWYVFYTAAAAAPYLVAINAMESLALANLVRVTWK
jgi:hypothetical protein